ncbi:hypothetical protein X747_15310 [Mesorhizobium sp. LNJC384A00]|nr:hypothetical protein X747_15310 [Mesorhizobium sp. LNJC384A00]
MRRELKRLRTYLGRVFRDVGRKIAGNAELEVRFARLLGLVEQLLAKKPKDRNNIYSLHAPQVVCISKAKPATRTNSAARSGSRQPTARASLLAARRSRLPATVDQAVEIDRVDPGRIYVDKGYRGHDYAGSGR